ncbi:MAG TPA: hypothetical protein QGF63_05490 [Alphaproteobacteria bacterium]|jgi:hypothetical protein|nr:hypothetical protein [Alphaproteobacteria bacterium]|tara:strand:+ start:249 stop:866 length:618 start_codon:yes stop_codon:yes gene_type:complete
MKFFEPDEKGKALCEFCQKLVGTTFSYRDVPFSDGPGTVKDILVAVCDQCDSVVSVPAQSTPAIKAARETAIRPIEVNLPAPFVEVLDAAAYIIDPQATSGFRKRLLAYYIHRCAADASVGLRIQSLLQKQPPPFEAKSGVPRKRLSFKVTPRLKEEIDTILEVTKLKKTDVIKGLVMQINEDIVRPKKPRDLAELQRLAAVVAG